MPVCQGRTWPNGPRTHQGGSVGRPWPFVIEVTYPPMSVPPYQFAPQLMYPVPWASWLYGTPEWRPLTQPTDWFLNVYQYFDISLTPGQWGHFSDFYRDSDGSYGWFGSMGYNVIQPVGTMVFGSQSPADWCFHFLDQLALRGLPYDALPASFCTGS